MEISEVDGRLSAIQAEWLNKGGAGKAIIYTLLICASLLSIIARELREGNERARRYEREQARLARRSKR